MKKALTIMLLLAAVAYVACGACLAEHPRAGKEHPRAGKEHAHAPHEHPSADKEAAEAGVINDTCPVMGDEVDKENPTTAEYKGKKIGLCCQGCVEKFNKDPKKYMAKIWKGKKKIINCPKCGAEIDIRKECKRQKGNMCPWMQEEASEEEK